MKKTSTDFNEENINLKTQNDYLTISLKDNNTNTEEDKLMKKRLRQPDYQCTFHIDNNLKNNTKTDQLQNNILGVHLPKSHRDKKSLLLLK
ncbi:Hsp20 family protein [Orenia metallireducens]|uniref:Hsp20 family protein n=1 Tax=Orenia metallireducens TaxID=1413210 RepID=UPI00248120E6|nr:Hsp20 family protein [Orenia metallireducens]